jgi:hypothetical protein
MVVLRAPILSQLNRRFNRAACAGGKKEANNSAPAETNNLGRMGEQFTIPTHVNGYFYLLFAFQLAPKDSIRKQ